MLDWIVLTLAMASADGEVVTYVHTDALGSPVAITDSHGNVIERFAYEPYGSVVGIAAADGPGYSGHVFDSTTGLNYMQQRYYSPEIGAFLSVDPVAAYGGSLPMVGSLPSSTGTDTPIAVLTTLSIRTAEFLWLRG